MKVDKIRNLTDVELGNQERELADQLFKLKFQLNMGQTESLKKIRGLRKDIARVKTILGERERSAAQEKRKWREPIHRPRRRCRVDARKWWEKWSPTACRRRLW